MKIRTDIYKTKTMRDILRVKAELSAEIEKVGYAEFNRRNHKRVAGMLGKSMFAKKGALKLKEHLPPPNKFVPGDAYWVGTNIFRLRRKKGLSHEQLAKAVGVSTRRLVEIQDAGPAIYKMDLETMSAIAKELGVETRALFRHHKWGEAVQV